MPGTWLIGARPEGTARTGGSHGRQWRAVVLGLSEREGSGPARTDSLDELERLAATDGIDVVDRLVQVRDRPDPATYLGSGKVQELAELVDARHADLVIAEGELTPAQVRGLEDGSGVRVVDRTRLILDIFGEHARSSEGKAQVELAQLAYELPRLRGRAMSCRASVAAVWPVVRVWVYAVVARCGWRSSGVICVGVCVHCVSRYAAQPADGR
ncbi:hypothetical protein [Streptomyces sp. Wb2n-11]|uniref:HflX-like GTP-binding protein n=1 Tax=Streptomyces sp. Wb2n-11 TaxID=1030533 RepID=UPI000AAE7EA3|nr:hypothetical protein [Streptomyces sp. Wb2n-11]